jgi:hypothetical protein
LPSTEDGAVRQRVILLAYWAITLALVVIVIGFALR